MTREQARLRLEGTTNFTFKGGRVLVTDQRTLATISAMGSTQGSNTQTHMPASNQLPTSTPNFA